MTIEGIRPQQLLWCFRIGDALYGNSIVVTGKVSPDELEMFLKDIRDTLEKYGLSD